MFQVIVYRSNRVYFLMSNVPLHSIYSQTIQIMEYSFKM